MKECFVFVLLIGFVCELRSNVPSSTVAQGDEKSYVMHDGTTLHWENSFDEDFTLTTGFYLDNGNEEVCGNWRTINGANDTTYFNVQYNKVVQIESIWYDKEYYQLSKINLSSPNWKEIAYCKSYKNDEQEWAIYTKTTDDVFQFGSAYNIDKNIFYDISYEENHSDDNLMISITLFFLIYVAWIVFLPLWDNDNVVLVWSFVGFLLSLISSIFIENHLQRQLFLPLLAIVLTSVLFKIPQYIGKIRYISQFILGVMIISFFAYNQFFVLNETVKFADGQKIDIKWQRGTCLIKRFYIRKIFSNMTPVLVNSDGNEYVVYVSKYEFSEDELSVINNEIFFWFCGSFNSPLDNLSFREAQIVLEILRNCTDVKFDFLSYKEWRAASLYKKHSPNQLEYEDVNEGKANDNGLVNILENMPEYTSNYYAGNYRLGLAADTLIRSYNNIIVAGSPYQCTDSINIGFVNKNIRDGRVGFRLVYRPNDIGSTKFCIMGHLRSDRNYMERPKSIKVVSIDGHRIEDLSNYESFEELLIECRFKNKIIEAIDLSDGKIFNIQNPKGFEYYDFEPIFSFVGL